jgi:hypothetical protein
MLFVYALQLKHLDKHTVCCNPNVSKCNPFLYTPQMVQQCLLPVCIRCDEDCITVCTRSGRSVACELHMAYTHPWCGSHKLPVTK